jgi:hypothetical protein
MRRSNRVRDAGVAGSNPATPTRLLTISTPYRDSYRDRNVSATGSASSVAQDEGPSEPSPDTLAPSQPIFLIVEPVNRRGLFVARLAENSRILCKSRTPFTDAARVLLREGVDPKTILISRKAGQDYDSLRSTVGAAAKITVDESKTRFARWKPLSQSAASPRMRFPNAVATPVAPDAGDAPQPPVVSSPDLAEEDRK